MALPACGVRVCVHVGVWVCLCVCVWVCECVSACASLKLVFKQSQTDHRMKTVSSRRIKSLSYDTILSIWLVALHTTLGIIC